MRVSRLGFIAISVVLFAVPATAFAHTYTFYDLGSADAGRGPLGITPSGSVVITFFNGSLSPIGLCDPVESCYETWTNGILVNLSGTNPGLVYDNGSPCTPTVSPEIGSANVSSATCNGAREVFVTFPDAPAPYGNSVFDGPNPSDFVAHHMLVEPFRLNASGDFVFIADYFLYPSDGEIFEYVLAPVPEPSSIFLFGIGLLAAAAIVRRSPIARGSAH
jgi:hypothetical protein